MGGAVDTVASCAHDPLQLPAVGDGDVPEVPQRIGPLAPLAHGSSLGDGAFGIIEDDPRRDAAVELESAAVAAKPGLDLLVPDHLGGLVPTPGQRHDEDPGPEHLAEHPVDPLGRSPTLWQGRAAGCMTTRATDAIRMHFEWDETKRKATSTT